MTKQFKQLTVLEAIQVYGLLVQHCDYEPNDPLHDLVWFAQETTRTEENYEWRFKGALGFGGKLYGNSRGWYVSCYPEDRNLMRDEMIKEMNAHLDMVIDYGERIPF